MSDTEDTNASDREEVLEFRCRKCPGKTFTAAEKDSHRQFHKKEKEKNKKKPGPKSKTRASRARDRSPEASEFGTLFEPVIDPEPPSKSSGKRRRNTDKQGPSAKRKSNKKYDDSIIGNWSNGTGA